MAKNGITNSTIHPMHKVRARINFVTSRTFVCRKRRGEPAGLIFRQGKKPLTCGQVGHKSRDDIDDGESGRQVQRYIRLTHLIPPLLRMVDEERIAFTPAVELSYLSQEEQEMLFTEIGVTLATPSLSQACQLKKLSGEGKLNEETIAAIMAEEKPNQREKVSIPMSSIGKYLPDTEPKRVQEFIIKACAFYKKHLQRIREEER